MKAFLVSVSVFLIAGNPAFAQKLNSIQTDRPDQTESPAIVPKGYLQGEFGFAREQLQRDNISVSYPSALLKYGVNDKFELRLIAEIEDDKMPGEELRGVMPLGLGIKISMCDEDGAKPKISFLGHIFLPDLASKNLRTDYYAPAFRFSFEHTLSEKFKIGYNAGAEWDGFTPEPVFIYTFTTGFSITERLGSYAEIYGFAPQKHRSDHRFDGGFTYLLNDDLQLDLSGGFGITKNAPDYFYAAGISYRLQVKKK